MLEPDGGDGLPLTIRVLITYYGSEDHTPKSVYLGGAEGLRPDL
jgi:chorismate mutase